MLVRVKNIFQQRLLNFIPRYFESNKYPVDTAKLSLSFSRCSGAGGQNVNKVLDIH